VSQDETGTYERQEESAPLSRIGPPSFESEVAAWIQVRLRLFAGVLTLTLLAIFVVGSVVALALGGVEDMIWEWVRPTAYVHVGAMAIALVLYLLLKREGWSKRALRVTDAVAMQVWFVAGLVPILFATDEELGFLVIVLGLLVFTRAVLVPSTGRRTLLISAPVVPGFLLALTLRIWPGFGAEDVYYVEDVTWGAALYGVLLLTEVWIAALASRVNFSLRREVHEAKALGPYHLEEKIGAGAMGEVYRATHSLLKRPTAVKLLKPEISGGRSRTRFEREVRLTSRLSHPNTIAVYDFGQTAEGAFYYAMELLDGMDLKTAVEHGGPFPADRAIHVLAQVAAGLDEAHALGLIHRDVKPGNIMVCRVGRQVDVAKVLDFGLVKELSSSELSLTEQGMFLGTPATAAPEQFSGGSAGPASDLYAVGAVGYYLLTGRNVFDGASLLELVHQHMAVPPTPPSRVVPSVPEDLESVVLHCLAKKPEDRPSSAAALRRQLLGCADAGLWTQVKACAWWERFGAPAASGSQPWSAGPRMRP